MVKKINNLNFVVYDLIKKNMCGVKLDKKILILDC